MASMEPARYEPTKWNDGPNGVQGSTNCYDYAVDEPQKGRPPGSKSQPGKKKGKEVEPPFSCQNLTAGAQLDGLKPSTKNARCNSFECWKVALVLDPTPGRMDYHWYRQDVGGDWSHKPGSDEATNLDANGQPITDPEKAARGRYTRFCGWFCVCRGTQVAMGKLRPSGQAMTALALIYSGRPDPRWTLSAREIAIVADKLTDLPPTEAEPRPTLGYRGFLLLNPKKRAGLPPAVTVGGGVVTLSFGVGEIRRYEDARQLEAWLLTRAASKPFLKELEGVLADRVQGSRG